VLAAQEANERYLEILGRRREQEERERQRLEQHKQTVADAAKRIRFD